MKLKIFASPFAWDLERQFDEWAERLSRDPLMRNPKIHHMTFSKTTTNTLAVIYELE